MSADNARQASVCEADVWDRLADVLDPEVPVLSILDLGIVRRVALRGDRLEVDVTPTYSGCPATEVIEQSVADALRDLAVSDVVVTRVLSPPWTTDWITDDGRDKLRRFGIAPPSGPAGDVSGGFVDRPVACPRCGTDNTSKVSEFGSTACKASYRCDECLEPFEYFKCL